MIIALLYLSIETGHVTTRSYIVSRFILDSSHMTSQKISEKGDHDKSTMPPKIVKLAKFYERRLMRMSVQTFALCPVARGSIISLTTNDGERGNSIK
jgi:hypothetical protein